LNNVTDWQFSEQDWVRYLETCPQATIFHQPGWYQIYSGDQDLVLCPHFQWEDGHHAILPLIVRAKYKGLLREASAGVDNGYGGLVSATGLSPEQVDDAYATVRNRYPNLRAYSNPHEAFVNTPAVGNHDQRIDAFTQVLPVMEPSLQRKLMNDTQQKHCKRAEKAGFRLEIIEGPKPEDISIIYDLYQAHSANWESQRWIRERSYFRKLFQYLGKNLVLFLAWSDDELSGFRLIGCSGEIVIDLFLATEKAAQKSYVGPFLIDRPLAWCHEHGFRVFDFMPSGSLEGVIKYKASFGAQPLPVFEVIGENRVGHVLSLARAFAKKDSRLRARP
jgi:hypothetical protein